VSRILLPLADLPPDLRHAVQFCPACGKHEIGLYYWLCGQHQAERESAIPNLPSMR
jgi:hypothetical protein